ncbi:MAG: ATP-binding cassette domain-containing protein, partial [Tardiphaga sp.]
MPTSVGRRVSIPRLAPHLQPKSCAIGAPGNLVNLTDNQNSAPLIEIEGLRIAFRGDGGRMTHAVDSLDLSVARGATLGLVGESGCGKSVTSLAIMGLLPKGAADISGTIRFDGFDLLTV